MACRGVMLTLIYECCHITSHSSSPPLAPSVLPPGRTYDGQHRRWMCVTVSYLPFLFVSIVTVSTMTKDSLSYRAVGCRSCWCLYYM